MPRLTALLLALLLAGCGLTGPASAPGWAPERTDRAPLAARAADAQGFPGLIARIDLCNEAERDPAQGGDPLKNPRAWHGVFHRGLDARDPDYAAKFAAAFKPWWSQRLDYARDCGAKVIWLLDGEGRSYPQPTSWLGNWWTCAPPEMTPELRRWMVSECKIRNLIFGVTVRFTLPMMLAHGNVAQVASGSPADAYIANIQAIRWGLGNDLEGTFRFIELDSNCTPESNGVTGALQPSIIGSIGTRLPVGMYVAAEFASPGYASLPRVVAWRDADRPKSAGTYRGPQFIMPPHHAYTPTPEDEQRIAAEVRGGDVLVMTGSWAAPENDWILRCWANSRAAHPN